MAIATPTLFIYFVFFITYRTGTFLITFVEYNTFIHLHSPRPLPIFFIASSLGEKNLFEMSDQDLNSGLPYSRPAHYQLNYAAPFKKIITYQSFSFLIFAR